MLQLRNFRLRAVQVSNRVVKNRQPVRDHDLGSILKGSFGLRLEFSS